MYINYYELRSFVDILFNKYKENDIKDMFMVLDNCKFINVIGDAINIDVVDDKYKLYFYNSYIGTMKSDLKYDVNRLKTKINILKYLLATNNCIYKFLNCLINMNAYKLKSDDTSAITVVSNIIKRDNNVIDAGKNICSINCDVASEVYSDTVLIGLYNYNGPFFVLKNNQNKDCTCFVVEIENKNMVLKELINYNNAYYKKNMADSTPSKSIVK